jgi:hypothetical protein
MKGVEAVERVPNLGNRQRRLTSRYGLNIKLTSRGLTLFNDDQSVTYTIHVGELYMLRIISVIRSKRRMKLVCPVFLT